MISKKERKQLIERVSKASGIAQYALEAKMTDEAIVDAAQNLDILTLIKDANNYNRYCQGQKTRAANEKIKEFLNLQNSEVLKAGKWLIDALGKSIPERDSTLLEKNLVHKDKHNEAVGGLRDTVTEITSIAQDNSKNAEATISKLEDKIDELKKQLIKIQSYIISKHGNNEWMSIQDTFKID